MSAPYASWAELWMDNVRECSDPARFDRGMRYASGRAVRSFSVEPEFIEGAVSGSRRVPYDVRIAAPPVSLDELRGVPVPYLAELLTTAPDPGVLNELLKVAPNIIPSPDMFSFWCSCPDWGEPCKHAVAVAFAFAAELAEDITPLLQFRGLDHIVLLQTMTANAEAEERARTLGRAGTQEQVETRASAGTRKQAETRDPAGTRGQAETRASAGTRKQAETRASVETQGRSWTQRRGPDLAPDDGHDAITDRRSGHEVDPYVDLSIYPDVDPDVDPDADPDVPELVATGPDIDIHRFWHGSPLPAAADFHILGGADHAPAFVLRPPAHWPRRSGVPTYVETIALAYDLMNDDQEQ